MLLFLSSWLILMIGFEEFAIAFKVAVLVVIVAFGLDKADF